MHDNASHSRDSITGKSATQDVDELKYVLGKLGGWPLLNGASWDDSQWSLEEIISSIRKLLASRTDKIFDIASFIINLENANNVSLS